MSIQAGMNAPDVEVDAYVPYENEPRRLWPSEYHGSCVVPFFYPRGSTFVCPTELHAFAARGVRRAARERIRVARHVRHRPRVVVRYASAVDQNVGRSSDEVLRVAQALRTGELRPVSRRPGADAPDRGVNLVEAARRRETPGRARCRCTTQV